MTHFPWVPYQMLSPDRPGPEQFCLRTACGVWCVVCGVWCVVCGVWVLDFLWKTFQNLSPGDFESTFIKTGVSDTEEGRRLEEVAGDSLGRAALVPGKVTGKERAKVGLLSAQQRVREKWELKARMGDEPEISSRCPPLPWLGISRAPQSSEGQKEVGGSHGCVGAL